MTQLADYPFSTDCPPATIDRHTMPPLRTPGTTEFFESDTYATVTLGDITAEVLRLSLWDPRDRTDAVGVEYEIHINGLPDNFGLAQILADKPDTLTDLAAVCTATAALLTEVQR